jgi:hypothetical protein
MIDHRQTARAIALGRSAIGATMLITPARLGEAWVGPGDPAAARVLGRALGARDLALGVGTFRALERGEPVATWVRLGALCDVVDLAATVLTIRRIGLRRALPVMLVAGAGAALGAAAADGVD